MLYMPLQFKQYEIVGLLDTGAVQNTFSENEFRKKTDGLPGCITARIASTHVQNPNGQRQFCPSLKTSHTKISNCRRKIRGNFHGLTNDGKNLDWNDFSQKTFSDTRY